MSLYERPRSSFILSLTEPSDRSALTIFDKLISSATIFVHNLNGAKLIGQNKLLKAVKNSSIEMRERFKKGIFQV